ncbi:PLC-like phosphodiesterase [Podospora didyma]|uniref:PLC-like phosphodiesterase n=1 Tax=Podospora didyma TaxID=330526 RepID=A0AAE0KKT3_9PEZI|nr:PLC-like phosphodiesterase [Podospora didyma]
MAAFKAAVDIGAHAVETDLHLSKDGVVVLSHDATLKRCFGKEEKIADCDWSYLSTLETLLEPRQGLPRLSDLLEYLAQPGLESVWVLLDIKTDDPAEDLLSATAQTLASVPTARPWNQRIVLGGWNENYIQLCREYLPTFPVAYIGFSLVYARRFLKQPGVNFNLLQQMLVGPVGAQFMKKVRKAQRSLFVWTVNSEAWMEWSIRKQVDGVITDDPKLFLEVCERWKTEGRGRARKTVKMYAIAFFWQVVATVFIVLHYRWLNSRGKRRDVPVGIGRQEVLVKT